VLKNHIDLIDCTDGFSSQHLCRRANGIDLASPEQDERCAYGCGEIQIVQGSEDGNTLFYEIF
jgi:hypothetical protein